MKDPSAEIVIIRTGSANLASVVAAFERLSLSPVLTESAEVVERAPMVVLPGVGAFGPALARLRTLGLDRAIIERVRAARATLAICLGMQLFCDSSEESPGAIGLSVVPGGLERFGAGVRVPQMGWNSIVAEPGCTLLRSGAMYFANSYRLSVAPSGWYAATADHGGPFVAAIERGRVLACQFHPELSGADGLALLSRWVETARVPEVLPC
jgi:imidazole glycerol phosphate synthase glutamine amidotransferase subunit